MSSIDEKLSGSELRAWIVSPVHAKNSSCKFSNIASFFVSLSLKHSYDEDIKEENKDVFGQI